MAEGSNPPFMRPAGTLELPDVADKGESEFAHLYDDIQILEGKEEFKDEERLKAAVPSLLFWFSGHARILPWREKPTPYRVWVSEIMLQQTRVEAVKPYFERFLTALPDIRALAEAKEDQLLKLWEGLGYYNRVRNMARAAREIMEDWDGEMPSSYEELLKLPGIGSYTAGAISSIAFGRKVPAVDGNVLRVVSRIIASRKDIGDPSTKRQMESLLFQIMPEEKPGEFNQALMEVGAIVCVPRGEPVCEDCPFNTLCLSRRRGLTGEIPVKKAAKERKIEKRTVLLIYDGNRVLLQKRPEKGLLAGMYEFPNTLGWLNEQEAAEFARECLDGKKERNLLSGGKSAVKDLSEGGDSQEKLPEGVGYAGEKEYNDRKIREAAAKPEWEIVPADQAVHVFSHVEWRMKGYLIRLPQEAVTEAQMVELSELQRDFAVPGAFKVYREKMIDLLEKCKK